MQLGAMPHVVAAHRFGCFLIVLPQFRQRHLCTPAVPQRNSSAFYLLCTSLNTPHHFVSIIANITSFSNRAGQVVCSPCGCDLQCAQPHVVAVDQRTCRVKAHVRPAHHHWKVLEAHILTQVRNHQRLRKATQQRPASVQSRCEAASFGCICLICRNSPPSCKPATGRGSSW